MILADDQLPRPPTRISTGWPTTYRGAVREGSFCVLVRDRGDCRDCGGVGSDRGACVCCAALSSVAVGAVVDVDFTVAAWLLLLFVLFWSLQGSGRSSILKYLSSRRLLGSEIFHDASNELVVGLPKGDTVSKIDSGDRGLVGVALLWPTDEVERSVFWASVEIVGGIPR